MFGEGRLLLDHPDFVADTWLNLASATWFLATPQPPKPSMLHVIDGTWQPNAQVRQGEGSAGAVCCRAPNEGYPKVPEEFTITVKAPPRAFYIGNKARQKSNVPK